MRWTCSPEDLGRFHEATAVDPLAELGSMRARSAAVRVYRFDIVGKRPPARDSTAEETRLARALSLEKSPEIEDRLDPVVRELDAARAR